MQDSGDTLSTFEQLTADDPTVANQVLFSAVGAAGDTGGERRTEETSEEELGVDGSFVSLIP